MSKLESSNEIMKSEWRMKKLETEMPLVDFDPS